MGDARRKGPEGSQPLRAIEKPFHVEEFLLLCGKLPFHLLVRPNAIQCAPDLFHEGAEESKVGFSIRILTLFFAQEENRRELFSRKAREGNFERSTFLNFEFLSS